MHDRTSAAGDAERSSSAPFTGGWFVLLGFELANEIEPSLNLPTDNGQPLAVALRVPVAIIRDRKLQSAWIVAEPEFRIDAESIQ